MAAAPLSTLFTHVSAYAECDRVWAPAKGMLGSIAVQPRGR